VSECVCVCARASVCVCVCVCASVCAFVCGEGVSSDGGSHGAVPHAEAFVRSRDIGQTIIHGPHHAAHDAPRWARWRYRHLASALGVLLRHLERRVVRLVREVGKRPHSGTGHLSDVSSCKEKWKRVVESVELLSARRPE
jgi:hypothetical protein